MKNLTIIAKLGLAGILCVGALALSGCGEEPMTAEKMKEERQKIQEKIRQENEKIRQENEEKAK